MKSHMDRGLNLLDFATTQTKMVECLVDQKISANNHMLSYNNNNNNNNNNKFICTLFTKVMSIII